MAGNKLVVAIIEFLKEERSKSDMSEDTKESLEVAIQCLKTAYDLQTEDISTHSVLKRSLRDIFHDAYPPSVSAELSPEILAEAEKFKNLGNDLMKAERNSEAVDAYTKAINLHSSNAVYYCNRSAAYSRLSDYKAAVKDCEKALSLVPTYSKAYGRMGLAYNSLGDSEKAIQCYKKAVELDPSNESYQNNLKLAEEKAANQGAQSQSGGSSFVDMSQVMSNPILRNLASRMMLDPNMVNIGQVLAQQMQASNPQFIEQLREQFLSGSQDSDTKDSTPKTKDDVR